MSNATTEPAGSRNAVDLRGDSVRLDLSHEGPSMRAPTVIPSQLPKAESELVPAGPSPVQSRVLARLLAIADSYRETGSLRQAIEMYFDLRRSHPETPEASQAEERLIDVAESFEAVGELRSARSIYEELL